MKAGLLRYPGNLVPGPKQRKKWPTSKVLKDNFWIKADKTVSSVTEHVVDEAEEEEDEALSMHHTYQSVFEEHTHR